MQHYAFKEITREETLVAKVTNAFVQCQVSCGAREGFRLAADGKQKHLLVHPIGCWLEPVDDLLVVDGKESDADETYNERDVVP